MIKRIKKEEIISEGNKEILIPSGSNVLDLALGGGFKAGKIVNVVGDSSTGKTFLTTELIATARKMFEDRLKWRYNDAESGYSFDTNTMYGFEVIDPDKSGSDSVEEFEEDLTRELDELDKEQILIYVLDSLDSLTCQAEKERVEERQEIIKEGKEYKKGGSYGLEKQKMLGQLFRMRKNQIKERNCLLIIISQVRQNIGVMFGDKYYRTGGKALDFYSSNIIWLAEVEKHINKNRTTGITIKAKIRKNKTGKPFRECFIDLLFDYGVDNIISNLNFLYDLKDERGKNKTKKKPKIEWKGKEFSLCNLIDYIEENEEEEELKRMVINKWNEIEESIAPNRKKKY